MFCTSTSSDIEVSTANYHIQSARSLVSALRIAYTIDRTTLLANPFFDVPISVAARAFLAQRTVMIPDQTTLDNSWIESNLGTCMDVLANMAQ